MDILLVVVVIVLCGVVGYLLATTRLNNRSVLESGKYRSPIEEVEGLVDRVGKAISDGIRASLGFDQTAILPPEEVDFEQMVGVRELDMDPFMRELGDELEWPQLQPPEESQ